jgi:hypothetical protein
LAGAVAGGGHQERVHETWHRYRYWHRRRQSRRLVERHRSRQGYLDHNRLAPGCRLPELVEVAGQAADGKVDIKIACAFASAPILLLYPKGRRSGKELLNPLAYYVDEPDAAKWAMSSAMLLKGPAVPIERNQSHSSMAW